MDKYSLSQERIVLIGRNGFIGSHFAANSSLHRFKIVAPSRQEADLTDFESLLSFLQPDDIVVNVAGYASATDTTEKGLEVFDLVNVKGVQNLAEACCQKKVKQLIHLSSIAAMGNLYKENVVETDQGECTSPYAKSKFEGEKILSTYFPKLNITILRPTSVFGSARGLTQTLCKVVSNRIVPLPGGGDNYVPLTYVQNIVHAIELCINNPQCFGQTFVIGDQNSYKLKEIIYLLGQNLNVKPRIIYVPIPLAAAAVKTSSYVFSIIQKPPFIDMKRLATLTKSVSFSISKFQKATGYIPPIDIVAALQNVAMVYLHGNDTHNPV